MSLNRTRLLALAVVTAALALVVALPSQAVASTSVVRVTGGGYGHGLGLSQYGAKGYALDGKSYTWILTHYYSGTTLKTTSSTRYVYVNLDDTKANRSSWTIRSDGADNGNASLTLSDGTTTKTVSASYNVYLYVSGGNIVARKSGSTGEVIGTFTASTLTVTANGFIRVVSKSGPYDYTNVNWRGALIFTETTSGTLKCVNKVSLENYLYGVVPREMPSSWPTEALRAQAVAARSYAYKSSDYDGSASELYCTTYSQVYGGHSYINSSGTTISLEKSSTNSAVNATKGQLVYYGSTLVTTYFASSTGGSTGNIGDIWANPTATNEAVFKSVTDNDSESKTGNNLYSWDPVVKTISSLSTTVLAKSIASTVSDSATITNISISRASNGMAKSGTITWSSGQTTLLSTGDSVRTTFGVNSPRVYLTLGTRYEQSESSYPSYSTGWVTTSSSSYSGGSAIKTTTDGATMTVKFTGTALSVTGVKSSSTANIKVTIDGVSHTYDCSSSSTSYGEEFFYLSGLDSGEHTATIEVVGTSTRSTLIVDSIEIYGTNKSLLSASTTISSRTIQDSSSYLAITGKWSTISSTSFSGGTAKRTTTNGSWISAGFTGSSVRIVGTTGANYGNAQIYIDGVYKKTVSLYSSTTKYTQIIADISGLSQGEHEIKIKLVTSGSRTYMDIDYFIARGTTVAANDVSEYVQKSSETNANILKSGSWVTYSSSGCNGGTAYRANKAHSSVTMSFYGTGFSWYIPTGVTSGGTKIYVDGKLAKTIAAGTSPASDGLLWSITGLNAGSSHSVTIVSTTNSSVYLDRVTVNNGWLYTASLSRTRAEETSSALTYTGTWSSAKISSLWGGSYKLTKSTSASATLSFNGTSVSWVARTGPSFGTANVYIDGVLKKTVNLYSSTYCYRKTVYSISGLTSGYHTIKIVPTGKKSSSSTNTFVNIDAFYITGFALS